MGTGSIIANKYADGFKAIRCHWDGYPEHVGRILQEHYTDPVKVDALINLGFLSTLGAKVGGSDSPHESYLEQDSGFCFAWHRDWQRELEIISERTMVGFDAGFWDADWLYIFDGKEWHIRQA